MVFWGVAVKSGKPFTHRFDATKGRLHLSMASLGLGRGTSKSVLQCNVGDRSPVLLCSLYPEHTESTQLNVEFGEVDDVTFSVLGPRSIHLSGYYLTHPRFPTRGVDDDELGSYGVDIAETDSKNSTDSDDEDPTYADDSFINDGDDEDPTYSNHQEKSCDKKKSKGKKHKSRRRLFKVSQLEDGSPIQKKNALSQDEHKDESINGDSISKDLEKLIDKVTVDLTSENVGMKLEELSETNTKCLDKVVDLTSEDVEMNLEEPSETNTKCLNKVVDLTSETDSKHNGLENVEIKLEEPSETNTKYSDSGEPMRQADLPIDLLLPNDQNKCVNVTPTKKRGKLSKKVEIGEEVESEAEDGELAKRDDERAQKRKREESVKDKEVFDNVEKDHVSMEIPQLSTGENITSMEVENKTSDNASHGLVIEVLRCGKQEGKVAISGKKICVRYVGKLMNTGEVVASNAEGRLFKFRLGLKRVIDAWEVGLEGMQIGEIRRLIVPPPMGYGSEGDGKNIPPDSWLVYEVELVKVR